MQKPSVDDMGYLPTPASSRRGKTESHYNADLSRKTHQRVFSIVQFQRVLQGAWNLLAWHPTLCHVYMAEAEVKREGDMATQGLVLTAEGKGISRRLRDNQKTLLL
jgi:hypothetical protein